MKRILGFFLAALMICTMLMPGAPIHAATASGTCSEDGSVTWTYADGRLVISGNGAMEDYPIYSSDVPWIGFNQDITEIVVEPGVTNIGDFSFMSCGMDEGCTVSLPDTVTRIGEGAFYMCRMVAIDIPDSVTELGNGAFLMAQNATEVHISKNLKVIPTGTFQMCADLSDVVIPNGVVSIRTGAFTYCPSLKSITIPSSVEFIQEYAFDAECSTKLDTVYFSGTWAAWNELVSEKGNEGLSGAPTIYCNPFKDIKRTASYFKGIMWAYEKNIVNGKTATTFAPNDNCTRAQFAAMLWKMNGKPSAESLSNPFKDVSAKSSFRNPIVWCYHQGIVAGTSATTFTPNANISRWQIVAMLWRMAGKPKPTLTSNPFTDIKTTDTYYKAALWAYESGITAVKTFNPNDFCTRWQLVLFLQRFNNIYHIVE